jgi:hypothetical protein
VDFPNVDGLVAAIVGEGLASLEDLRTRYTLEEALDLFEIVAVRRFNEWEAIERGKRT